MHDEPKDGRRTLTEREFDLACEVFARTGSKAAAILSIAGGATDSAGRPSRRRTLEDAIRRNPEWAARWEDAKFAALGLVESEIAKAALTVDERPIFDAKGRLLGVQRDSRPRNDMLKFLARKLDPDAWSEKRQLQMSGTVEHRHTAGDQFSIVLRAEDVLLLPPEQREQFVNLLSLIRDRKSEEETNVIDHTPTRIVRPVLPSPRGNEDQSGDSDPG
jgi:hypothetical protein